MLNKKSIGVALVCALALGASGAAFAAPITVGGVTWDPDSHFDLTVVSSSLIETSVANTGDTLMGYGLVGGINQDTTNFCQGCQLAFTFQYTVADTSGLKVLFNQGAVNFYVIPGGTYNPSDPTNISSGTLWLSLTGHNSVVADYPAGWEGDLFATASGSITDPTTGSVGAGFLDATGGLTKNYFDTHTQADGLGGFADFYITTNFSIIPNGPFTAPNGVTYSIEGGATLTGNSMLPVSVPEPAELGLLGLGLGFLGFLIRRRRKEAEDLS